MIFVIVYVIIGAGLQPNVGSDEPVLGQIIFVDDIAGSGPDNPPENYTSIQDAINAASDGDHLYVYKGLYRETIRIPEGKNNIHIVGEEKTLTIIDACQQLNTDAFFIHGGCDFTISDMTIRNSSRDGLVIYANTTAYPSSRNVISNCVVTNHRGYGIKMYVDRANTSVDNNQVRNCQIYENDKSGIFLSAEADTPTYAMNNRVVDSLMYSNGDHGVELTGNQHTESTVIQGCTSYNNQGAGVFVDGSYVEGLQIGESTFFQDRKSVV